MTYLSAIFFLCSLKSCFSLTCSFLSINVSFKYVIVYMMQRWSGRNFTFVSNNNDSMVNYFLFSVLHWVPKSSIWKITNCSIQHETALIVGTIADKYLVLKTVRRNNVVIVWLVSTLSLKANMTKVFTTLFKSTRSSFDRIMQSRHHHMMTLRLNDSLRAAK